MPIIQIMINGINSSISGLFAFSRKLANTSNNVANSNTDGYKKTVASIVENEHMLPDVSITRPDIPGPIVQEPEGVIRELSNTDLAEEMPQMILSQRGYEANLKALKTQDELLETVLDIIA